MNQQAVFLEIETALSHKFSENVNIKSHSSLGGGCINHASKIVTNLGEFFVKWNASCAEDMFLREAEGLRELKKAAGNQLKIPEIYAVKKVDETPGFLVQEFLKIRYSTQSDEINLGRGLAHIHKYTAENYGFYHDNYCGATPQKNSTSASWVNFYKENRLLYLINLLRSGKLLSASELVIFDKLMDRLESLLPENKTPSLIHGDLWSGNYMITENGPALIDPAAYFANREMEFGIITMFGGFSSHFYGAYNEVFPLENDWRTRNKLYQLYHILNHYYLFGGSYLQQAISVARLYI